jgi:GTP pyrophosphokinase
MPVAATLSGSALAEVASELGHEGVDGLFAALGEGQVSAQSVLQRLERLLRGGEAEQVPTTATRAPRSPRTGGREAGIYVEGLDDVMIHLARCCTPVPGDEIIGFVTMGRGVSVHRTDCSNAAGLSINSKERLIEVEWDASSSGVYRVNIEVLAFDRARLLSDVTQAVSEHKLSIVSARTQTTADRVARMDFEIELADPTTLGGLLAALKRVDGVFDAYRQLPGARG